MSPRQPRGNRRARRFPFVLVGAVAGLVIAFGVSGSSYAYFNSQASLGGAVISSGSLSLTTSTTFTAASVQGILPGEVAEGQVSVTTSNVRAVSAITARVTYTHSNPPVTVTIAAGACSPSQTPVSLASAPTSLGNFGLNDTRTYCVRVGVPLSDNSPNTDRAFSIIFDAVQRQE